MTTRFRLEHHLGYRILRWVLVVALLTGMLLSTLQIILDAEQVSEELDQQANQTLALVRDASTQAIFSIDSDLARQVIDGLFQQESIRHARIVHPDGEALAQQTRPLAEAPYRRLTDPIFLAERSYRTPLSRISQQEVQTYGHLEVSYDTSHAANLWLERARLTFFSGIARAVILGLVLYVVYHVLLTRPLFRIITDISQVNPDNPGERLLQVPKGHRRDELGLWVNATNNMLLAIRENQEKQQQAEDRVNRMSRYDHLTGLPNRAMFLGLLQSAIEDSRRNREVLAAFCCGIDDFKSVNEQHGFHMGDRTLQIIAERLSDERSDRLLLAARLGSDQFIVVERHLRDDYQAAVTAEWLMNQFSRPITLGNHSVHMSATIGVALYPADADHADQLLQRAEQTMMLAKTHGKGHFQFYVAEVDEQIRERKQLEKDLGHALREHQLHLVYQPQVSLENGRILGAEALLRWTHPKHGLVPPDHFIPLAELNGFIVELGRWVLDEACRQAAEWAEQGILLRIAVNLSAVQLRQPDLVDCVLNTLSRHRLPNNRLELEVTETGFMENLELAIEKLNRLRDAGISIAVDDFGTGYSSLTYLKRLPVQNLKIDKQFIRDLLVHEDDTRIANTIIDLGRSLNLDVIAEGVETAEQEMYLRERGCQMAQGYHFSKPLAPADFVQYYTDFHNNLAAQEG
ncbi:MAG: EAL domain-containing protein [Marinobacter sp.]|nr:EAL domain-containing protein [Marinobacter sp.]